ncbi:hypothetical protein G6F42_025997 [Rhizopus arrhizus]|nr:hypothetical protein G6F42_025997 [Rhizopus arrhizus]
MHMKFIPLGLIASIVATVSARSLYSENSLSAVDGALTAVQRRGLAKVTDTDVGLDNTAHNILNGLEIEDVLNCAQVNILADGSRNPDCDGGNGGHHGGNGGHHGGDGGHHGGDGGDNEGGDNEGGDNEGGDNEGGDCNCGGFDKRDTVGVHDTDVKLHNTASGILNGLKKLS